MKKAAAIISSFLTFLLLSCGNIGSHDNNRTNTAIHLPAQGAVAVPDGVITAHLLTNNLQGLWGIAGDENALFVIVNDRIIYPEIEAAFRYYWKNDSMKIKHDGYEDVFSVSMRGPDTLVLTGNKKQVYIRFKTVG